MDSSASLTALRQQAKKKFGGNLPSLCSFWWEDGGAAGQLTVVDSIRLRELAGKHSELELWVSDSDKSPR